MTPSSPLGRSPRSGAVAALLAACGQAADAGGRVDRRPPAGTPRAAARSSRRPPTSSPRPTSPTAPPPTRVAAARRRPAGPHAACLGDGPAVRLAGLRGTPAGLNLWASWCEPCRDELPLFADLAGASGSSLRVLGIDVQDDPGAALSLLADAGVHYASVRDDDGGHQGAAALGPGLPMTVFVDADGVITHAQRGAITQRRRSCAGSCSDHLGVTVPS